MEGNGEEQRELLTFLLGVDLGWMTLSELQAHLGGLQDVEGAVEVLVANNLLVREVDAVMLRPAAIRFHELLMADRERAE